MRNSDYGIHDPKRLSTTTPPCLTKNAIRVRALPAERHQIVH